MNQLEITSQEKLFLQVIVYLNGFAAVHCDSVTVCVSHVATEQKTC